VCNVLSSLNQISFLKDCLITYTLLDLWQTLLRVEMPACKEMMDLKTLGGGCRRVSRSIAAAPPPLVVFWLRQ
jgi:hypothetical protein